MSTSWPASGAGKSLPGPRATLFFAPAQVKKRSGDWGPAQFGQRMVQAWQAFLGQVADPKAPWLTAEQHAGPAAVQGGLCGGAGGPRGSAGRAHPHAHP